MPKALNEQHVPVMAAEVFQLLAPTLELEDSILVDCTLGLGGHSAYFLSNLAKFKLIGIDQDTIAMSRAQERLKEFQDRVVFVKSNFSQIKDELLKLNINKVNAFIFDLGISSIQIDEKERGFSYLSNDQLDMRMNQQQKLTAKNIVNEYTEAELAQILLNFGEERFAKKIAKNIVKQRQSNVINTTGDLVRIIEQSIPAPARRTGGNPAKKTFQALRIEVNSELEVLKAGLVQALALLAPGGRIAVLTYHSLEDRIVKEFFKAQIKSSNLPRKLPVVEALTQEFALVPTKAIKPSHLEVKDNPRSRSAKLRGIEKLRQVA